MPDEHAPLPEHVERDLYRLITTTVKAMSELLDHAVDHMPEWLPQYAQLESAESLALELAARYGVAA